MTTTSVSSPRVSWVVRLSSVSGTIPRLTLVHPSSWARISRAYKLLHHFFPGCHGAPGGKSSLPGATSATRGRRSTSTLSIPSDKATPMRCGVKRSPWRNTTVRRRMSVPHRCTDNPHGKGWWMSNAPASTVLSSILMTVFAPRGSGAPVIMRIACWGARGCSRCSPAVSVCPSSSRTGCAGVAVRVSLLRNA